MPDLQVIDATTPVELGVADEVIRGLKERLTGLSADTQPGYQIVKAGISEVRGYRTGVEKSRKELKKSALDWGRKVDAEAKRVTALLEEIEAPLKAEKDRIDDEAVRIQRDNEEKERLAIEARKRAEREAVEAEEEAKREVERKEWEEANANLAEERKALEADRERHESEQRWQQEQFEHERQDLAAEREKIEADKRAVLEKARRERHAEEEKSRAEAEAVEAAEQKVRDEEDRVKASEAMRRRLVEEKAERERIAEEQLPDREKLKDFARRIEAVKMPRVGTAWGNGVLAEMCDHLQSARDVAYDLPSDGQLTEDDLAAVAAAKTVSYQTPSGKE